MYYVVGLGNPGEKYEHTRHNVGRFMIETFIKDVGLPNLIDSNKYVGKVSEGIVGSEEVICLLPQTFMNQSGGSVKKLVPSAEISNLILVYDDVDLPLGELKVSVGRGSGGHNGVSSVINSLGSKDFVRVRIGIAPKSFWSGKARRPEAAVLPDFVLKRFTNKEAKVLASLVPNFTEAIKTIVSDGVDKAMNQFT